MIHLMEPTIDNVIKLLDNVARTTGGNGNQEARRTAKGALTLVKDGRLYAAHNTLTLAGLGASKGVRKNMEDARRLLRAAMHKPRGIRL